MRYINYNHIDKLQTNYIYDNNDLVFKLAQPNLNKHKEIFEKIFNAFQLPIKMDDDHSNNIKKIREFKYKLCRGGYPGIKGTFNRSKYAN